MKLNNLFITLQVLTVIFLIILGHNAWLMYQNQIKLEQGHKIFFESFVVANELHQSSVDLTRYCRNYILTGNNIWEKRYWQVLAVRSGKVALQKRIQALGLTKAEFDKLKQAEQRSNDLVSVEKEAFFLMKGLFDDGTGQFILKKSPDPELAKEIIFDKKYHAAKANIIQPIDEFLVLLEQRMNKTTAACIAVNHKLLAFIIILIGLIISTFLILFFIYKNKITDQIEQLSVSKKEANQKAEELSKANKLLAAVLDNSPTGIIIAFAPDGRVDYVNDAVWDFRGKTNARLTGINIDEYMQSWILLYPDGSRYQGEDVPLARSLLTGEQVKNEELIIKLDDGTQKWAATWSAPIYNDNKEITAAIVLFYDITQRKYAEQKLQESEEKYKLIFEKSNDAILLMDGYAFIDCNDATLTLFGYADKQSLLGRHPAELSPEKQDCGRLSTEKSEEMMAIAYQTGFHKFEWLHMRVNGNVFPVEVCLTAIPYQHRQIIQAVCRDLTQRKLAEQALKQSEERLNLAMLASNEGLWDWQLSSNKAFLSSGYYTMLGYKPDEFPPSKEEWQKRVHPDDLLQTERVLAQYLAGARKTYDVEYRLLCKGGTYTWVRSRGQIVASDKKGKAQRMIGTHVDVNEYHKISEKLYKSELLKTSILNTIPDLIFLKSVDGSYLACNPKFEQFINEKEIDIIGKTDYDFFGSELADYFCEQDKRVIKEDRVIKFEDWVTFNDHRILTKTIKIPLKLTDGTALGVLGVAHDITQRKQKEDELHELTERLQKISASVPGMVYQYRTLSDGRSCFPYVSEGIRNIYQLSPEEVREDAARVWEIVHPDDVNDVRVSIEKSIKNLERWEHEYRVLYKDGTVHWLFGNAIPERGDDGSTLWHGFISNITERKQIELQLIEAQQQAESANKLKSEFLANMSHEIRTPMNAILGFTDILKEMEYNPKKIEYLQTIQNSGQTLLNLINDILDLSKIESGKMELHYSPISIHALLDELQGLFSQIISEKGLSCACMIDVNMPEMIVFDETRLRQVLMNLVSNAIKFTHQGFVNVTVNCEYSDNPTQNQVNLTFIVADSGIGIPKSQQDMIFASFAQVQGQKEMLYGGTGLGLAITKCIMELVGGTISIESEEGVGTRFALHIPDVEIIAAYERPQDIDRLNMQTTHFAPACILIVDDVDYNRDILEAFLAGREFKLYFAQNGQEAIEKTHELSPDLILLDMKMPVMDGYQAAKELKSIKSTQCIPIIAVTAFALNQDESRVRQNCEGYLRKPVSKYDLFNELMLFLPYTDPEKEQTTALADNSQNNRVENMTPCSISTKQAIAQLPQALQVSLKQAVTCVDIETLENLLEQIAQLDSALSDTIRQRLDNFEYERLLALFE